MGGGFDAAERLPGGSEIVSSTTILLLATAVCGAAAGLGYRGRMQVVNEIAPQDRRAAVTSGYFVCVYCGNALPVIGIGVISTLTSSLTATLIFAATVSLSALIALRLERADELPNPVGRRGSGYRGICARAIRLRVWSQSPSSWKKDVDLTIHPTSRCSRHSACVSWVLMQRLGHSRYAAQTRPASLRCLRDRSLPLIAWSTGGRTGRRRPRVPVGDTSWSIH